MRKISLAWVVMLLLTRVAMAGEGMWIPMLLGQLNKKEVNEMG